MGKETQTHGAVHCMWGTDNKIALHHQTHYKHPITFRFATLIGHFLGSSKPPAWLFSLHCMVYVVFSLCACAWPRWGTQLQFAPPSPQQTCTSRSGFYFFLLCVFLGPHPTRSAHERHRTGCRPAEQILANVCKALSDSHGSFRPSLAEVEALLGDDWGPPLHATVPGPLAQQYEFEARHFRDLTSESYVTDGAQIVVYYWWAAQTALSADWDTMGVAWAVRDSLWNASCASPQRRQALVESWARSTLERASIDMSFAPPLIVAQIYNSRNFHWVLRLLLIAPTREYLCLKFDPLLDKPHIVGANKEELAVVDELAEREGIQPQPRRKWATFLDAFGSLAFAIAPLYSTFIRQDDFVSCHPACLLMLHCALSRRVVKGDLQVPQDRLWLLREMAQATLYYSGSKLAPTPRTRSMHWEVSRLYPTPKSADPPDTCFFCDGTPAIACQECKVLHCTFHTTVLCQSEICVGLRQFRAAPVAAAAAAVVAFAAVTAANATHATPGNANATDDTRPGVWICRKWYALPPQYPQNADGQLENDQAFCRQLHLEKKEDLFERCKLNPTPRGKPHKRDTKADLIFKRVFCNYL